MTDSSGSYVEPQSVGRSDSTDRIDRSDQGIASDQSAASESVGRTDRRTIPNDWRAAICDTLQWLLGYPSPRRVRLLMREYPDATYDDWCFVLSRTGSAEVQPDGSIREGWVRAVLRNRLESRRRPTQRLLIPRVVLEPADDDPARRYLSGRYGRIIAQRLGEDQTTDGRESCAP